MRKATTWKAATGAAVVAAVLFIATAVATYMEGGGIAWFPLLMALAWFLIAGLFYQRARGAEQHNHER
jgi:hypothetical protein